jgi:hypothetical protein
MPLIITHFSSVIEPTRGAIVHSQKSVFVKEFLRGKQGRQDWQHSDD